MTRPTPHKIEDMSTDLIRTIVNRADALFRELTRRDYGIDAVIEFFDREEDTNFEAITGKICYVQIKGTESFKKLKLVQRENGYTVQISSESANYSMQDNIPFFLLFASTKADEGFYFAHLQDAVIREKLLGPVTRGDNQRTMHVPVANHITNELTEIRIIVDQYYDIQ